MPSFPIAALHKLSTLDYPGLLCAVIFTQGCNFSCPYCHNAELIPPPNDEALLPPETILDFLHKRKSVLDGLVISGGEPSLHATLPDFCAAVKRLGYRVKLDTNGSRPELLGLLLNSKLVDYVAMDCKSALENYTGAFSPDVSIGLKISRSIDLLQSSGIAHEFRSTCCAPAILPETVVSLAKRIGGRSPWFLQEARLDASMLSRGLWAHTPEQIQALLDAARAVGASPQSR